MLCVASICFRRPERTGSKNGTLTSMTRRVYPSRKSNPSGHTMTGFAVSMLAHNSSSPARKPLVAECDLTAGAGFAWACRISNGTAERCPRCICAAFSLQRRLRARMGQCSTRALSALSCQSVPRIDTPYTSTTVCGQECTHLGTLTGHSSSVNSVVGHSAGRLTLTASSGAVH